MSKKLHVLILEDDEDDVEIIRCELEKSNIQFQLSRAANKTEFESLLTQIVPDIILSDYMMPAFNPLEAIKITRNKGFNIPFIIISGNVSEEVAVEAMKHGAYDYVLKDRLRRLPGAILNAIEKFNWENEHLRVQREISRQHEFLATIVDSSEDAIISKALDDIITSWNKGAEIIFGYKAEEVIGKNILLLIPEDELAEEQEMTRKISNGEYVHHYETKRLRKDGSIVDVSISFSPLKDYSGVVVGAAKIVRDITARKYAEKDNLFKANLLRKIGQGVAATNKEGKVVYWNEYAEKIYGWTANEVLGKKLTDVQPTNQTKEDALAIVGELMQGKTWTGEFKVRRKDGTEFPVFGSGSPLYDHAGNITGIISVTTDITEHKQIEKENADYRRIVETAQEGIVMVNEERKISFVNKKFANILEYTTEELIGKHTSELTNDSGRVAADKKGESRKEGISETLEFMFITKSGREIWTNVIVTALFDEDKKFQGTLSMVSDITERKKAQQDLFELNEQLRSLTSHLQTVREEERTNIAREVHDELGQQMTSLKMEIGWVNTMTKDKLPEVKDKIDTMTAMVNEAIKTIRKIVIQLRPGILDDLGLEAAIEWQAKEFEKNTGIPCVFKSINLQDGYSSDINTAVFRIFQESLTNVTRYAKAKEVQASLCQIDNQLILELTDNGIGISEDRKNNKTSFGILGMKERASMLKGSFDIRNTGHGTMIQLKIPI